MYKELIIAKYSRTTEWVSQIDKFTRVTIYNKNRDTLTNNDIFIENNVGRCVHTFFNHICNNYHSIADVSFFVQDYPFDHVPDLIDIVNNFDPSYTPENQRHLAGYYYPLGPISTVLSEANGGYVPANSQWSKDAMLFDMDSTWEVIFRSTKDRPNIYTFVAGGHFAITKTGVQSKPLSFYTTVRNLLENNFDHMPHEIERLEGYIFNPSIL